MAHIFLVSLDLLNPSHQPIPQVYLELLHNPYLSLHMQLVDVGHPLNGQGPLIN